MQRLVQHIASLWGKLWVLPLLVPLYTLVMLVIGDLRPEHVVFSVITIGLAYASVRSKQFLVDVAPYVAVGLGYDVVRYLRPLALTPERVLGCELRDLELSLFPLASGVTFQDWFSVHHAPAFDLLFAVPYTIFVYLTLGYAAFLYFKDRPRMRRYLLAFAFANYISFAMWLIVPAAPPWYLRAHGCLIDLSTAASPAALSRVDALLGIQYFDAFYSRAASVFGALPSMHCAYPFIGLLTAWRVASWRTKPLHILYVLAMFGAAVYLDHHWIIDAFAGYAVATVSVFAAQRVLERFARSAPQPIPAIAVVPNASGGQ